MTPQLPVYTGAGMVMLRRTMMTSWWQRAACKGRFSREEGKDLFFDYGRSEAKIRAAKNICRGCPVRRDCLSANLWTPRGIFGGYTEAERMALVLRLPRRPRLREAGDWFDNHQPAYNSA